MLYRDQFVAIIVVGALSIFSPLQGQSENHGNIAVVENKNANLKKNSESIGFTFSEVNKFVPKNFHLIDTPSVPENYLCLSMPCKKPPNVLFILPSITLSIVDKSKQKLYIYDESIGGNSSAVTIDISSGKSPGDKQRKGDKKTPVGVYYIGKFISPKKLSPMYGAGAFPLSFPNHIDRSFGAQGKGIWIHGIDKAWGERPKYDTEGCVVMSNVNFQNIMPIMSKESSPIIIVESVNLDPIKDNLETAMIFDFINQWSTTWRKGELNEYYKFYGKDFRGYFGTNAAWKRNRKFIFKKYPIKKLMIQVRAIIRYPDKPYFQGAQYYLVDIVEEIVNQNLNTTGYKRLYLEYRNHHLSIAQEEWATKG